MKQTFFVNNRQKLVQALADDSIAVLFAGEAPHKSADANYPFKPNRHYYYLTGLTKPSSILVITKRGNQVEETLFIEKVDPVLEKWTGKMMTADEAKEITGIGKVQNRDTFEHFFHATVTNHDYKNVYFDLERRGFHELPGRAEIFARKTQEQYPMLVVQNLYRQIAHLRLFKTQDEIVKMKRAIEITKEGIERMVSHMRPGVNEAELEAHFTFNLRTSGAKHYAFDPIVAGGARATVLHYEENDSDVQDGELVLVDIGAEFDQYNADITRTFPVNGTFSERQKAIYNLVLKAEQEVINAIKPGVPFTKLNEIAKQVLAEGGKELGLIDNDEELINIYYHGVSHSLGLDTHDVGDYRGLELQPGMVLTVEPGLYISEEGIGIRIEDDVLVTEDGCEVLSKDILKTVDEIEAFMAKAKATK
ncbi:MULTISPECIES: aminopeptidase P family protein [Paenibacillus]|uniref:Xaa-Pro aminopeptidase n=1 Tax=Paenibacillus albilobatus TaxID=2716884 RepID=A0A919XBA6_9BACL|nr:MULTISPECIES: aminopeptidase P family protein [Paenibacillus]GIO28981.1 Xaa-Pro aminopeptidase [Paenibacillus albilobatus]